MLSSIRRYRKKNHGSLDQSSDCAHPDRERDLTSMTAEKRVRLWRSAGELRTKLIRQIWHRCWSKNKQLNDETRADGSVPRMRDRGMANYHLSEHALESLPPLTCRPINMHQIGRCLQIPLHMAALAAMTTAPLPIYMPVRARHSRPHLVNPYGRAPAL